jgi:FtsP/CotA-like multicopper oxidase with cupredoxin domain
VRFRNDTDAPTTIHWHGLRVPEDMDGVQQMDNPVEPGGTFTYEFEVKDAGLYWYHPHMDTAMALERGLYGTIVAREPGEKSAGCDLPVVLDDVLLNAKGQIAAVDDMTGAMGRLGDVLLANGRTDLTVPVVSGEPFVLRLVNAANARYFDLTLEGHDLTVVGTDGGWIAQPYTVSHLVVAPGERYLVRFDPTGEPGETFRLMNSRFRLHAQGAMMAESDPLGNGDHPVMSFEVKDAAPAHADWEPPAPDVPDLVAGDVVHRWVLNEVGMMQVTVDGAQWPDVPVVDAPLGDVSTFEVENRSEMHHPFHLHGQRVQPVSIDGVPVERAVWKDTLDIPPGSVVKFASRLDNPGDWLYHCHILEHAEAGMAGILTVE